MAARNDKEVRNEKSRRALLPGGSRFLQAPTPPQGLVRSMRIRVLVLGM